MRKPGKESLESQMELNTTQINISDMPAHILTTMDITVATVYILEAIILIPLHILCSYLMCTDKEMKNATYALMINLSIADCIELLMLGIYAGVVILVGYEESTMARIASFLCLTAWYANCVLFPLIAFSRWICITKPHMVTVVFSKRILWTLQIAAWLILGIPSFYGNIIYPPGRLFPFIPTFYTWAFAGNSQLGLTFNWLNIFFDSCCTGVEMGFNILSLIWVHKTRQQVQTVLTTENRRREIKLLIQCVILGCIFTATYIIFTIVSAFKVVVTATTCLVLQAVWTFNHSVNPIVYLTVNKRLRRRAIEVVTCGKVNISGNSVVPIDIGSVSGKGQQRRPYATV